MELCCLGWQSWEAVCGAQCPSLLTVSLLCYTVSLLFYCLHAYQPCNVVYAYQAGPEQLCQVLIWYSAGMCSYAKLVSCLCLSLCIVRALE